MSAVMAIALICSGRYSSRGMMQQPLVEKCQSRFSECYETEKGNLDMRLIKCIRKGN